MKLGKALSTGYAKDAHEHDTDGITDGRTDGLTAPTEQAEPPAPARGEVTAEARPPQQVVDAAAR